MLFFKTLLALFAVGTLAALLLPVVQLRAAKLDAAGAMTARRHLYLSGLVVAVAAAAASGFSFAGHAANVTAIAIALIAGGVQVLYSIDSRPRILGAAIGLVAGVAWLLALLFCAMSLAFDNAPVTVALGDGLYCSETVYGFAAGDSGEETDLYQRYLVIDHRVYDQIHSDIYPNDPQPERARFAGELARCQAGINQARAAGAHPG